MIKVVDTFNISNTSQNFSSTIGLKFYKVSDILKVSTTFIIVDFARLYLVIYFFYGLRISTMMKVAETLNISNTLQSFSNILELKFCEVSEILKFSTTFIIMDILSM